MGRQNGLYIGNREDGDFQLNGEPNVDLTTWFLDNDYEDPDLDRYLETYQEKDPAIGIIGDAYTVEDAKERNETALEILDERPNRTVVVAVKSLEVVNYLDPEITLGLPNGSSDITVNDIGYTPFRGRDVHIMGGGPPTQYDVIDKLTCNTLGDYEPANVVGVDWNGYWKAMVNYGEYWTCDGYRDAAGLTLREQVDRTSKEIRQFWEDKDLFPETTPEDLTGPAVQHPDEPVFANSGEAMRTHRDFETAYIGEYETYGKLAFRSERAKRWFEYREGVTTYS